jgi:YD repeat-containing protein
MMGTQVQVQVCPKCGAESDRDVDGCKLCGFRKEADLKTSLRTLRRAVLTIVVAVAALTVGVYAYSNLRLLQSAIYKESVQLASTDSKVQSVLGTGIHEKYPGFGELAVMGRSQFAEWSVEIAGSHGRGRLYAVANRINDVWSFSRLMLQADNGTNIEITPVHRLQLPTVPEKRVYLVPVGYSDDEHLDWVGTYYERKLGINVVLLPGIPLDPADIDKSRSQLDSYKCVEYLQRKFPDLAADPSVVLIGITSADMYIPWLDWWYADSLRSTGRYAMISTAHLHPPALLGRLNPAWLSSRVEKLLTKDLAILYFDLPLSSDYTSLLSGGILSSSDIDQMGDEIVGSEGHWDSFVQAGEPALTIYDVPQRAPFWRLASISDRTPAAGVQVLSTLLETSLFVQRKTDFTFPDEPAMLFSRVYRNHDDRSRALGIGGSHSLDLFIVGQMGVAIDLVKDDGVRVHFVRRPSTPENPGDLYQAVGHTDDHLEGAQAIYSAGTWQVKTKDGWTYFFPYRPKALPQYVTVLTSFVDPVKHRYEMTRDSAGSLLEIKSESGNWLRFENDSEHRITRITSSTGRSMNYEYDSHGHMIRATDFEGYTDSYTFDNRGQMSSIARGNESPIVINEFDDDGFLKVQTLADGRKFEYAYSRQGNTMVDNQITEPNGLQTYVQYVPGGYLQSLPQPKP